MDYHSDRFRDHSLMFFKTNKLVGVMPANIIDDTLHSHSGLTFGGIVSNFDMKVPLMIELFEALINHCKEEGLKDIVYKAIPYIYHSIPADEDLYVLFRCNATLIARNVSSSIYMPEKIRFEKNRRETIGKGKKNNLIIKTSSDLTSFMKIVEEVLKERHEASPVHNIEELKLLMTRFPDNIKLFASYKDDIMLAGTLMYESKNVAHCQYMANSNKGWTLGALDTIVDYLIRDYYICKKYFDFGISTEKLGQVLNTGLIMHKEGFGARAIVYDFYRMSL